jgi:hypothetical protein
MKFNFIIIYVCFVLSFYCCGNPHEKNLIYPDHSDAHVSFRMDLENILTKYIKLKNAFVNKDEKSILQVSFELYKSVDEIPVNLLNNEEKLYWNNYKDTLLNSLKNCIDTNDIVSQRRNLVNISSAVLALKESFKAGDGYYVQFCPVSNYYWLSESYIPENPYLIEPNAGCCGVAKAPVRK